MKHTVKLFGFALGLGLLGFLLPVAVFPQIVPLVSPTQKGSPKVSYSAAEANDSQATSYTTAQDVTDQNVLHLQVSLIQRQVTLYRGDRPLKSYPIAVGKAGWETPVGNFRVQQMIINPEWIHPLTNEKISADDPRNPLGDYWIGFWSDGRDWVGFHGTPDSGSVGMAISHGCLRMHNEDIRELFQLVHKGTIVTVTQ